MSKTIGMTFTALFAIAAYYSDLGIDQLDVKTVFLLQTKSISFVYVQIDKRSST